MIKVKESDPLTIGVQGGHHIPTIAIVLIWAANLVTVWSHRIQSRKELSRLDHSRLTDLGISREAAERESLKRFWMP